MMCKKGGMEMHLGNAALHDEEVGVVDIELDALERVLDTCWVDL